MSCANTANLYRSYSHYIEYISKKICLGLLSRAKKTRPFKASGIERSSEGADSARHRNRGVIVFTSLVGSDYSFICGIAFFLKNILVCVKLAVP